MVAPLVDDVYHPAFRVSKATLRLSPNLAVRWLRDASALAAPLAAHTHHTRLCMLSAELLLPPIPAEPWILATSAVNIACRGG